MTEKNQDDIDNSAREVILKECVKQYNKCYDSYKHLYSSYNSIIDNLNYFIKDEHCLNELKESLIININKEIVTSKKIYNKVREFDGQYAIAHSLYVTLNILRVKVTTKIILNKNE